MVEVKVLEKYFDKDFDRNVDEGETINVSPERFEEMKKREKEIGRKFFEEIKQIKSTNKKSGPSKK
ncbi:hypothetical protein ANHYDRO_01410 [Anaerococcus hydrogenalis DSM 7454]|uniref:Uncharacterized protein n=1 Tax=Anaerococcus hydrogenalis DSM 7454 TaxID=561177 RepID=B6W9Y4_9FIRM|nr:hypothetical protein [Anaerococcus hydrogenalis]EEB35744.1 hypothetical protein ANHYDRO_01410 [Anaerococcus hydrogenalis DSM 7454]